MSVASTNSRKRGNAKPLTVSEYAEACRDLIRLDNGLPHELEGFQREIVAEGNNLRMPLFPDETREARNALYVSSAEWGKVKPLQDALARAIIGSGINVPEVGAFLRTVRDHCTVTIAAVETPGSTL